MVGTDDVTPLVIGGARGPFKGEALSKATISCHGIHLHGRRAPKPGAGSAMLHVRPQDGGPTLMITFWRDRGELGFCAKLTIHISPAKMDAFPIS